MRGALGAAAEREDVEMLRNANRLLGYRVAAVDGEIGRVVDFLFDEWTWGLRYLVVQAGPWLSGRRVLIAPQALPKAEWTSRRWMFGGARDDVARAPAYDQRHPVTPDHEQALAQPYGWSVCDIPASLSAGTAAAWPQATPPDTSLRSLGDVIGFALAAEDGKVGHVDDVIVEDDDWSLPYLVIGSRNWLSGRKLLVPSGWVDRVRWSERSFDVPRPSARVEAAPEYDPSAPGFCKPEPAEPPPSTGTAGRSWNLGPRNLAGVDAWAARGLRAALARIIHG